MAGNALYKVYDQSNNFLGVLDDVVTDMKIPNKINTLGGSIELTLARNSDSDALNLEPYLDSSNNAYEDSDGQDYISITRPKNKVGPGSMINHNYRVDIVTSISEDLPYLDSSNNPYLDSANQEYISSGSGSGTVSFSGFISNIKLNYGGSENTVIRLTSYGLDLDQYVVESSGSTKIDFNDYDPSDIVRGVINLYQTSAGSGWKIGYDSSTIDDTSTIVNYTFNTNTTGEGIKKSLELAPKDWYFYLDQGTNLLYFKERPVTISHYFYLGKDIQELDFDSDIIRSANDVLFTGGDDPLNPGENIYVRSTSAPAANTRRMLIRESDNRVTEAADGNIIADGIVERNNGIVYDTTVTIFASTYDINSIKLGQLVAFRNADNYIDTITLQVMSTDLEIDRIALGLGTLLPSFNKQVTDLNRRLELQETINNPVSPS